MKFSERLGITPVRLELSREEVSSDLANQLWSTLSKLVFYKNNTPGGSRSEDLLTFIYTQVWEQFFKKPSDTLNLYSRGGYSSYFDTTTAYKNIRVWFFAAEWYQQLDFLEFCAQFNKTEYLEKCNELLRQEMSAYRFVAGKLVETTSEEELAEVNHAVSREDSFAPVKAHLASAIAKYSDRQNPDYRNSVKESISAVEALAKIIAKDGNATLGSVLNKLEKAHGLHGAFKDALSKLYGWTSSDGGIRHSLTETSATVAMEDAKLMLVICSAFTNYLIDKCK